MTGTSAALLLCGLVATFVAWSADKDGKGRQRDISVGIAATLLILALVFG